MNPEQNNAADAPQTTIPAPLSPPLSLEEIKKQKQRESNLKSYYKHHKERIEYAREYNAKKAEENKKANGGITLKPGRKRIVLE